MYFINEEDQYYLWHKWVDSFSFEYRRPHSDDLEHMGAKFVRRNGHSEIHFQNEEDYILFLLKWAN